MNLLQPFKKKKEAESMAVIRQRIGRSQEAVYKAIEEIGRPVNGLAIARHMNVDSAGVTPRLAELTRKGRIKIAYRKRGLDRLWRNFYVVSND